jgi:hypothetical protein
LDALTPAPVQVIEAGYLIPISDHNCQNVLMSHEYREATIIGMGFIHVQDMVFCTLVMAPDPNSRQASLHKAATGAGSTSHGE